LLKEQVRKKKLSKFNEEQILAELKNARQVLRKEIPEQVVAVNKTVRVTEVETKEELSFKFVAPDKAKRKNKTHSILSPQGVAMLGHVEGTEIQWETPEGIKTFRIEEV